MLYVLCVTTVLVDHLTEPFILTPAEPEQPGNMETGIVMLTTENINKLFDKRLSIVVMIRLFPSYFVSLCNI
ncbi:hypothetical protein GOP47_0013349 [Adiantum capillus-veneris]|uniref:Uncharacterized protein n=1 Tax=Adiantum capillus-veneris TaxID=13818 RepID=A0A9D4UNC0_ADICA|nr:hypothetical protein GOP47_0013349 [Adiantum capillus-veneris]